MTVPAQGASSKRPDPKDGALYHVIPANDTKGSVFGPTSFPRRRRGSNPGPPAQEASALTTRLPRFKDTINTWLQRRTINT